KDGLTGAYSRSAFHRDYDCGTFESIGFVLVDADRLAVVNRERSRDEGDEVLRRICSSMREVFGEGVYRIGDDEFCAVALPLEYEEFDRMTQPDGPLRRAGCPSSVGLAWSGLRTRPCC
ncbi:MAG: GGDEF domain-containing protein, partial [Adlercreutzia equolifaciens]